MSLTANRPPSGPAPSCADLEPLLDDMKLETPKFSKTDVRKAGSFLSKTILAPATSAEFDEAAKWFRIAHNWRSSHILPMRHVRMELERKAREHGGFTAARLKRMQSIRKKLPTRQLNQIQDIAGCRVICNSMTALRKIVADYNNGATRHLVGERQNDYIAVPRESGYRSHHLVLTYVGSESTSEYNGLRVELQIRTRLQHAWATAIEAVGLYANEDLKGGRGDARWLRFFQLMASESALSEGASLVGSVPESTAVRREEIQDINREINALNTLETFRHAIKGTDMQSTTARHYMIQYDHLAKRVSVTPYFEMSKGSLDYNLNDLSSMPTNAVLVEVERVEDLKSAFPNYFLDVALFAGGLKRVLNGEDFRIADPSPDPKPTLPPSSSNSGLRTLLEGWPRRRGS